MTKYIMISINFYYSQINNYLYLKHVPVVDQVILIVLEIRGFGIVYINYMHQ